MFRSQPAIKYILIPDLKCLILDDGNGNHPSYVLPKRTVDKVERQKEFYYIYPSSPYSEPLHCFNLGLLYYNPKHCIKAGLSVRLYYNPIPCFTTGLNLLHCFNSGPLYNYTLIGIKEGR